MQVGRLALGEEAAEDAAGSCHPGLSERCGRGGVETVIPKGEADALIQEESDRF